MIFHQTLPSITRPIPPVLYKFMESRWLPDFMSGKSIRVGTLGDFRKTEAHGLKRGDPLEGAVIVNNKPGSVHLHGDILRQFSARGIHIGPECIFEGQKAVALMQVPDLYVYCTSKEFDEKIASDLDSGYDCCVEIRTPTTFLQSMVMGVSRATGNARQRFGYDAVTYANREFTGGDGELDPNPFKKGLDFIDQGEFRFIFGSVNPEPQPINVKVDMSRVDAVVCWQR